jgi:tryptophan-rich sensory protein
MLFEGIGFLMGLLTQDNIYPWYHELNKSSLTPPGSVFSVVWTFLYILLAVIAWILFNQSKPFSQKITWLFSAQMLMNWAWTPLFFGLHWTKFSALWLVGLTCLTLMVLIEARKTHKTIAYLLLPYLVWLVFASYLNAVTALMN